MPRFGTIKGPAEDKELVAGRVRPSGAGHRYCGPFVFQAVAGFVVNMRIGGFSPHIRRKAACPDHKSGDAAVKNYPVVETLPCVLHIVFGGYRCGVGACVKNRLGLPGRSLR